MSTKISALPAVSSVTGSDIVPIVQGGATKSATLAVILTAISAAATTTPEANGAVGDGVTDDTAAFAAAFAALAALGGGTLILGARTYLVTGLAPPANCWIVGQGWTSVLLSKTNANVLAEAGSGCGYLNFKILGDAAATGYARTSQSGIYCAHQDLYVAGIFTTNLGAYGQQFNGFTGFHQGPMVVGCVSSGNGTGQFAVIAAEYVAFTGCKATGYGVGGYGLYVDAGNVTWTGGELNDNYHNVYIVSNAGNNAHGVIAGAHINHASHNCIKIDAETNGFDFVGCHVYQGGTGSGITLTGSKGVRFTGGEIDCDTYNFDGSVCTFSGVSLPSDYPNTVNNDVNAHPSITYWTPVALLSGLMPAFALYDGVYSNVTMSGNIVYTQANMTAGQVVKMQTVNANSFTRHTVFTLKTVYSATTGQWTASGYALGGHAKLRGNFDITGTAGDYYKAVVRKNGTAVATCPIYQSGAAKWTVYVDQSIPCASGDTFDVFLSGAVGAGGSTAVAAGSILEVEL